jgi:hypothetical protein
MVRRREPFRRNAVAISATDRDVLRELGERVAELAALPAQGETVELWKALNSLEPVRPMVAIDQIPWNEMNVDDELTLQTQDDLCRRIETGLRRTLYRWEHMRADMVVEPYLDLPKVIRGMGYGIGVVEEVAVTDPTSAVVGHRYEDQLPNEEDVEKIQTPDPVLDGEVTARIEETARQVFDGVLTVRMQGARPTFAPLDRIVQWRGGQTVLRDLAARPDFMHALIERVSRASQTMLDRLEERGLLGPPQSVIHCTGAFTDELPAPGFDPDRPRARDLWTFGMSQIFSAVSPAMHEEFELEPMSAWFARFGLAYYGCCEPLDLKVEMIRKMPGVRKVSMSPWVDVQRGAERLGGDYVFSRKPSPALLARPRWDPDAVRADLEETAAACARHGCPLELILKDISTVSYKPQRLWEWVDVAMDVALSHSRC